MPGDKPGRTTAATDGQDHCKNQRLCGRNPEQCSHIQTPFNTKHHPSRKIHVRYYHWSTMFHLVQTSRKMLIGQFYEESLIFLSAEDPGGPPNPTGIAPSHAANAPAAAVCGRTNRPGMEPLRFRPPHNRKYFMPINYAHPEDMR